MYWKHDQTANEPQWMLQVVQHLNLCLNYLQNLIYWCVMVVNGR